MRLLFLGRRDVRNGDGTAAVRWGVSCGDGQEYSRTHAHPVDASVSRSTKATRTDRCPAHCQACRRTLRERLAAPGASSCGSQRGSRSVLAALGRAVPRSTPARQVRALRLVAEPGQLPAALAARRIPVCAANLNGLPNECIPELLKAGRLVARCRTTFCHARDPVLIVMVGIHDLWSERLDAV